jgi:DNA polymerase-3 subunit gamma/tau
MTKSMTQPQPSTPPSQMPYRVLARQYRPQKLSELVGQDLLVKTLAQGIERNRLPHAFLLHGIRGVGKTTTARILAKALNCLGANGQGGPTPDPCGVCDSCVAIIEDRHLDVLEMDAMTFVKLLKPLGIRL